MEFAVQFNVGMWIDCYQYVRSLPEGETIMKTTITVFAVLAVGILSGCCGSGGTVENPFGGTGLFGNSGSTSPSASGGCSDVDGDGVCDAEGCPDENGNKICDTDENKCHDVNNNHFCDEMETPCANADGLVSQIDVHRVLQLANDTGQPLPGAAEEGKDLSVTYTRSAGTVVKAFDSHLCTENLIDALLLSRTCPITEDENDWLTVIRDGEGRLNRDIILPHARDESNHPLGVRIRTQWRQAHDCWRKRDSTEWRGESILHDRNEMARIEGR